MRPPEMLPSEWKPFPFSRRSRFGDDGPRLVTREPKLAKAARKRKNDEVEAEKDLDRIAREARRRQERTDEFNRQADERRANEEETSRLAPPIAAPGTRRLPATPFGTTGGNRQSSVPNSVRSWQEEGNVYGGANVGSSPLDPGAAAGEQQHAKLPPPQLPNPDPRLPLQHLIDSARRSQLPAPLEPPERLSQAHGTGGPFAPSKHNNMFVQRGFDQYLGSLGRPLSTLPGVPKPPSASLGQHQRDRDATLGKENGEPDHSSSSSESSPDNRRRRRRGESPEDDEESENEAQNVPKHDHAGRVSSSAVPDDRGSFWSWLKRVSTWRNMCWLFTFYVIMMLAFQHLPAEFPHIRSRSQSSVLSDEQFDRLNEFLKDPSHLTPGARENLKALLPGMIHVQRDRKGKLVIDKEFWHAIKERIQADESVLTLDDRYRLSERHWKALKDQFPVATAPPVVQSWETWLKQNEKKVINLVGKHFDDLVKERLPPNVVSNDEFLRELEAGLAKQKKAMAGDLDDIKATMRSLVDDITKLKSSPKGMSEAEVSRLVDRVVNKAIGRAQLRHAAKNNIAGSLDPELQNRINYFAFGNGASIDSSLTSPTVKIGAVPRVPSESWYKKTMKQPAFIREGHAALSPWQEAGQCWCAAIMGSDNKTFPGDVGVQTSNLIIPEFIVLEHINPAETNDPGAMPKDIELWADIIEPQRKIVRDWAVVSFPRTYTEPDVHDKASDMRLVKIAEFTYKYDAATNGAFVKRLSPQLVEPLQAATDTFLIRARSNHGADHTCFYRIRMYGQNYDIMENIEGEEQRAEEVFEEETPAWRFWN
ncbi:hypothetical protein B0T16DRAFT_415606 [Cercophora newfieldiana]|uniref:SUN domain-containing protein n=1 Tax=Cercophora newfieldiana TaxID=92897 RepID=A0AA40CMX2_9PEZI|nr:hypothetical protein B0T16DRAFT_415606 [Cercophora newfieldiana]